jgi:hypothetical protein
VDRGHSAAGLSIALHATGSLPHRDPRDRPALQGAFERNFAQLPSDRQLLLLQQLEKDEIVLPSLSSEFFFDLLWRNIDEGISPIRCTAVTAQWRIPPRWDRRHGSAEAWS